MTHAQAATTYRQLRRTYVARQNRGCTIHGTLATAQTFDAEARNYLRQACGIYWPSPSDWVDAARAMLAHLKANGA